MKRKLVGILSAVLALSLGAGILTACKAPDEPEAKEGEVYRTSVVEVNVNVSAYVSFKDISEANEWGQSGKVYEIIVSSYGGEYGMWSDGYWNLEGDTLTLTAVNADEKTCFVDAQKDVAKTYTAVDGVFSLPAKVAGGECTFTLDPEKDAVGENEQPPCAKHVDEDGDGKCDVCGEDMPEEPCIEHLDEDKDGKCDVCGEDMPTEQPSEGEVQVTLAAQASIEPYEGFTVTAEAKLELYTNETWVMSVKTDADPSNPDFVEAASGTYAVDMTTYAMTLTVTEEAVEESLPETFTVNCDASAYPELAYSAEVAYTSAGFTFNFAFADVEEEEPVKTPLVTLTGTSSISPYEGFTVNADAKLELYEDGTWALFIKTDADPLNPDFVEAASGTYTNTQTEMTLTVTEELMEESLPATISVAVNAATYPTIGYSADFTYTSTGFGFAFELTGTMEM